MTYYLKQGNTFKVTNKESINLHEELPVGTYTVKYSMDNGYYIETIDGFSLSGKIYGDTLKNADRILNTFNDRPGSTGVLLSGEKGSGKTLLAKKLALQGQESGIPTIVINSSYSGEEFNTFMQKIDQPIVVIFDEFEKVYSEREDQEQLLTLLDGVYPSKKLFIITCNDKYRINSHMLNRPGRIFYRIEYAGLSSQFIVEYCTDNLRNKTNIESVCRAALLFAQFNFDILKAMVEEMNRYDESAQEVLALLNAKPESGGSSSFNTSLSLSGVELKGDRATALWSGNPLSGEVSVEYRLKPASEEKEEDSWDEVWGVARFESSDLKGMDVATGSFTFSNSSNQSLVLSKFTPPGFDWSMIMV